jgi:hypothetical protein
VTPRIFLRRTVIPLGRPPDDAGGIAALRALSRAIARYPALYDDSRAVIRSNSSVSGSPTSRPNSVSPYVT